MANQTKSPAMKRYIRPLVFYARLDVEATTKKTAEKKLNELFERYFLGLTEDGIKPETVNMNRFHFEECERQEVEEL